MKAIICGIFVASGLPLWAEESAQQQVARAAAESAAARDGVTSEAGRALYLKDELAKLAAKEASEKPAEKTFSEKEQDSVAAACQRYPDITVENSTFRNRLQAKLSALRSANDPVMHDPNRTFIVANEVAVSLIAEGYNVNIAKDGVIIATKQVPTAPLPLARLANPTDIPTPSRAVQLSQRERYRSEVQSVLDNDKARRQAETAVLNDPSYQLRELRREQEELRRQMLEESQRLQWQLETAEQERKNREIMNRGR
ncbi:hypothetical protein JIN84_18065 [Luteolibacter yonseiensis]|uniref:Uncharacterized protein n=1 Tax=Luteolibacter yonseiensis TaxID=1144680 RepID=A0A934R715_9BACT|nr:hypothetical protein [Luteolibacter yonseiensis]MBK1817532.1 hypothetical protein [Luteolibacter yonseiensis]